MFDSVQIFKIRKEIHEEVCSLPHYHGIPFNLICPVRDDYDQIEHRMKIKIARQLWENAGKPKDADLDIWLEAEKIWDFCRHRWIPSVE